jgi:peptidylprolyl isomerase
VSRERRRRDRRQRRVEQSRPRRRNERGRSTYEPAGPIEFPGIMGWLQRRTKVIVVGGIIFLVVSLGAGSLFATGGFGGSVPDPTPTPVATPDPDDEQPVDPDNDAEDPDDQIQRTYDAPPEFTIDPSASYEAVIHLEGGRQVRLELFPDEAPEFVNNFVFLAENRFYDGLTFHRVVPGFVAQAGDPRGDSSGGPGYWLSDESNPVPFDAGIISMAKAGAQVSGSQFFITLTPQPVLHEQGFTAFGRVVEGFEHIEGLTPRDPQAGDPPGDVIESIEIIQGG